MPRLLGEPGPDSSVANREADERLRARVDLDGLPDALRRDLDAQADRACRNIQLERLGQADLRPGRDALLAKDLVVVDEKRDGVVVEPVLESYV
jgi:hypothetical protein